MAVVVEYQAWDSASYNWLDKTTSTSAPIQINNKLDAWVAAVNANASNTNKQITVEKDPSDSTSANIIGWVIKLASDSTNSTTYAEFRTTSATQHTVGTYSSWTTGTANGGYGTMGATGSSTSSSFTTSGSSAEFIVATETANEEEFFCLAYKTSSASVSNGSGCLLLFKDTAGEWVVYIGQSSSFGSFYLPTHASPTRNYGVAVVDGSISATLIPFVLRISGSSFIPAAGSATTVMCTPKSQYILANPSTSVGYQFARYAALPSSRTAVCMGYSPIFVSYA